MLMNKRLLSVIPTVLTGLSFRAQACSPVTGFVPPTVEQHFQSAKSVFFGHIVTQKKDQSHYKLEVAVDHVWKGRASNKIVLETDSSTCSAFGQWATPGSKCIFFLSDQNDIITGVNTPNASYCLQKELPEFETIETSFQEKIFKIAKQTCGSEKICDKPPSKNHCTEHLKSCP